MPLAAGVRFGPYEIVSALGAGGMGEVYRARDSKLKRDVALKVLPAHVGANPDRIARLDREAELLAALNHANIAQIYGFEQTGDSRALVMELVEGEDLATRIRRGPLAIHDAVIIARQIAEALDAAHERGIVHRDLKPANIRIREDGTVKVLDFGLAKMLEPIGAEAAVVIAQPTMTSPAMTAVGVVLGTAAYMSPEQARGKPVDKRADIWAFGCVLYEMLARRRPFDGETVSDAIAAIIEREPKWEALPAETPAGIRRVLARCLEKDPRRRLRDAGDAIFEIEQALARREGAAGTDAVDGPRRWRPMSLIIAGAATISLIIGSILGWWFFAGSGQRQSLPLARLSVDFGAGLEFGSPVGSSIVLAPNGQRLVFVANNRLFSRRLDQAAATELAGTQGAYGPFFSPDGSWVGFFASGKLKKVPVDGGEVLTLCDAPAGRGGTWGEDDVITVALSGAQGLSRVPAAGGTPQPLTDLLPGEFTHRWPQILPGNSGVVFTMNTGAFDFDNAAIGVVSLADKARHTVQQKGTFGRYFAGSDGTGYLTFITRGVLYAAPFDSERWQPLGTPFRVLENVLYSSNIGAAQIDFSSAGTLVYRSDPGATVHWLDRSGKAEAIIRDSGDYSNPALSNDGERLALIREGDLWVYYLTRGNSERLTHGGDAASPVWTHDDRHIIFRASTGMSWVRSDGGSKPQPLTRSENSQVPSSVAPDGKRLAFIELIRAGGQVWHIWTVDVESGAAGLRAGRAVRFLQIPFDERLPDFSPDGQWLAYASNESGEFRVYVRAFPDNGQRLPISSASGVLPRWRGNQVFFVNAAGQLMSATIRQAGASLIPEAPQLWSDVRLASTTLSSYSVSADASRVIGVLPADTKDSEHHAVVLFNAFDAIRRLAPAAR